MSPFISAVIPTYNRASYLRQAISSLVEQSLPKDQYDIIVVDNCSTDDTQRVVREEFKQLANLKYLHEPVLGLNQARNAGWQEARGDYVAYTDDDATVCFDWLERILQVFESEPKPIGCVGGRVEPIWEIPRPPWLSPKFDLSMTILDWTQTPGCLSDSQWLVGANMAFPRKLLESVGGFQFGVDRTGNKLLSGGEIVLQKRLLSAGYGRYYHPQIAVKHHVTASRLTQQWFIRRWFWQGVSEGLAYLQESVISPIERARIGLYKLRQLALYPQDLLNALLPTENPDRFFAKCVVFAKLGYIAGLFSLAA